MFKKLLIFYNKEIDNRIFIYTTWTLTLNTIIINTRKVYQRHNQNSNGKAKTINSNWKTWTEEKIRLRDGKNRNNMIELTVTLVNSLQLLPHRQHIIILEFWLHLAYNNNKKVISIDQISTLKKLRSLNNVFVTIMLLIQSRAARNQSVPCALTEDSRSVAVMPEFYIVFIHH